MGICGSCFGSGKVTCSGCGGRRHVSRYGADGVETTTCAVCYGSGRMRCNFCGGRGQIDNGIKNATVQTPEDVKQMARKTFQKLIDSCNSSVLPVLLASTCLGIQEAHQHNIGLPIKKARKVLETQDRGAFQMAFKDFVNVLEQGGWIK